MAVDHRVRTSSKATGHPFKGPQASPREGGELLVHGHAQGLIHPLRVDGDGSWGTRTRDGGWQGDDGGVGGLAPPPPQVAVKVAAG